MNTIYVLLNEDRHLTLRELEMVMNDDLGDSLSQMLIFRIVTEKLGFCKVCAQWVPHQLLPEHKTNCMAAAPDFLERYEHDSEEMLSRIVTGDDTWVHHFTHSTKKKSMVWKEPKESLPKKIQNCFAGKQGDVHVILGREMGHMTEIPSQGHNH